MFNIFSYYLNLWHACGKRQLITQQSLLARAKFLSEYFPFLFLRYYARMLQADKSIKYEITAKDIQIHNIHKILKWKRNTLTSLSRLS